ncbi:MAG: hypothetical protein FVQ83_00085 [Chloroflexi bacterium]|nr:hypothetical protein [Chloroflexota bacterium]
MRNRNFWNSISLFESGLSAVEWMWRITTFIFIGGSGAATAFLAKADPQLKKLGPIYWVFVGLVTMLVVTVIFYLIKSAILNQAKADFNRAMASPRTLINPLLDSFKDAIISVEDLRLPISQLHENKHFKRCKFVGPAAIGIIDGTFVQTDFVECGDVIALPEKVSLVGIVVLKNCTVEECQFIRTTLFTDQNTAKGFANIPGAQVKGISK